MFLKTVPPVVAIHSEWRSGKSLSLPLCFNDSASESDFVSSSGTPIPHKVQMIIDSLCSTQSSDMSNEVNSSAQSASLNLPKSSCGGHKPCHMDTLTRSRRAIFGSDATDSSDSDDSVDRGIEEAIQEYLKGKVEQKHKREPEENQVGIPKLHHEENCVPDVPKQFMHSTKVLSTSPSTPKSSKQIQPLVGLKKKKKNIKPVNPFEKSKQMPTKASSSRTFACLPQVACTSSPFKINEEDSSSDDGIEDAIQRFQQEEKERHEGLRCFQLKEVLDSSSDDGIEEAIRNYQQERQKEREHTVHPKQSCLMAVSIGVKPHKKNDKKKSRKKNAVEPEQIMHALPKPVGLSFSMLPACCMVASGDSLRSSIAEKPQDGQHIHSTLTVNTTAELMCAEAILDISKTVMPAAFEPSLDLANTSTTETASFSSMGVSLQQNEKSNESSVDSEDGIEQEIRKFLELKAKLHEQATTTNYPEVSTVTKAPQHIKAEEDQNKALKLSFSLKRKRNIKDSMRCKQEIASDTLKEEPQPKPLNQSDFSTLTWNTCNPNTIKNSNHTQYSPHHGIIEECTSINKCSRLGTSRKSVLGSDRNYSSDKSSSLDSDEDLDAAIKDLLKTKKRATKKVRDMKFKARKNYKPVQLPGTDTLKKHGPDRSQKFLASKPNVLKSSKGLMSISRQDKVDKPKCLKSQRNSKKPKRSSKEAQVSVSQMAVQGVQSSHVDKDSSSVDSDDSIEQEIRRFLAEKAKGSSTSLTTLSPDNAEGAEEAAVSTFGEKYVKEELRMKSFDLARALISVDPKQEMYLQDIGMNIKGQASSFASCHSLEEGNQLHDCRKVSLKTGKDCAQKVTGNFTDKTESDTFVINATDPQQSKDEVQHQNLFLLKHDNCSISSARKNSSADLLSNLQNRSRIPLIEAVSTVCTFPSQTRKHCLSSSSETLMVAKKDCQKGTGESRSESFDVYRKGQWDQSPKPTSNTRHASSNPAHLSQHLPPYPSHLSCVPLPLALSQPRASASLVHLRRDQTSVVALSAHKSPYLQLKNSQKDTRKTNEDREEESDKCIDETDIESGDENTDRRQQQCNQSLFTCIDSGVLVSPYIALNTEERRQKFRHYKQRHQVLKCAKRKLQFVFSSVMMKK